MKNKLLKKMIAILMIMAIVATDFFVLGSNLISYAASNGSTNNENIEFSAYFKDEEGNRVNTALESIKKSDLKMYAEIKVNNEGYFNGSIELQDSNFKIKNNIVSDYISSIEGNKVNLKQINAGSTIEIELDIEPIVEETIRADLMDMESKIKLTGQYMEESYKGLDIEGTATVKLAFKADETAKAELDTEIITNDLMKIDGTNKRIIQLLIKSRLSDNQYPITQTTVNVDIPQLSSQLPEEIKVLSLGTKATNGQADRVIEGFTNENGKIQITLKNDANNENKITWNKNAYDELIVTLIYSEDVDASAIEFITNIELMLSGYAEPFTASSTRKIEGMTLNNTISTEIKQESSELYKGQLYVNTKLEEAKDIEYRLKSILEITDSRIIDSVIINEVPDTFRTTDNTELVANTKFVRTEINKDRMLEILGQNGNMYINDGETIYTLNKDTETNESGNIVLEYLTEPNELTITTTKPEKAGLLEFNHIKAITKNSYSIDQLKMITKLVSKNIVQGALEQITVNENSTETTIQLTETITKAELIVDKENLSTMTSNNELTLGVKLITDGVQYDLYKNPTIQIQLPKSIGEITVNSVKPLYADGFEITNAQLDSTNKIIYITLIGEQLNYPETQATQLYLQITLTATLSNLMPSTTDKITLIYTNENATQYDGGRTDMGVVEKQINIVSPSGLISVNNIETYNIEAISGISVNKQLANIDKNTAGGTDITYNISLVNNTKSDVNNVRILGNLPTSGKFTFGTENIENNLNTVLKSEILSENATIYYTNNENATEDINNLNNGWTQNLSEVMSPKLYLIIIPTIGQSLTFNTSFIVTLPEILDYDLTSYSGYKVIYNEGTDTTEKKIESLLVGITTGEGIKIEANISATVGNETLNSGDTVKAGEVIRYTVSVKNNGTQTLENVILKGIVPEGTVYVEPDRGDPDANIGDDGPAPNLGYPYSGASYYIEKNEVKEVNQTIEKIGIGEEYSFSYEVRVNMNITDGDEVTNKAIATYQDSYIQSNEIKNTLSSSKIRATIKSIVDEIIPVVPNGTVNYAFFIENFSDQPINNISVQFLLEGVNITKIIDTDSNTTINFEDFEIISEIPANGNVYYKMIGTAKEDATKTGLSIKVKDSSNVTYRSNVFSQDVEKTDAEIELYTANDGEYVNMGDEITYTINVKNTGTYSTSVNILDEISEYLEIKQIYLDDEIVMQTTDFNAENYIFKINNNVNYSIRLVSGESAELKIIANIKYTEEQFETKIITNSAKVLVKGKQYDESNEVSHILSGSLDENISNVISGVAWLDENQNGQKDSQEKLMTNIRVLLLDVSTNNIAENKDGNRAETVTDINGEYSFTKISNGKYIVLFEFDTTQYELTEYKKEGVSNSQSSKTILKAMNIEGQEKNYAVTDVIELNENISNINIGLKEKLNFDLELDKYISRISIQNSKGTKSYEYKDSVFQKVEINRKQLNDSLVVLEYTIRVTNAGEIAGNVNSIIDYLDNGLEFSSELNPDWYLSGNNLYTNSLSNEKIQPGETREIKLILTKKMNENNVGIVNNRAEIAEYFNDLGKDDIDSIPNNLNPNEDDFGLADVSISISTGIKTVGYTTLILINIGLISFAIYLIFKKHKMKS